MKKALPIILLIITALACSILAQGLTAKQIIAKAKQALATKSTEDKVQMTLVNKRGETRQTQMRSRAKSVNGLSRTVTTFIYPNEVKGTKFLMIENAGRDADMSIFIPDLGRVRTISGSQRNQSYMGSDFAYGDLDVLDPEKGDHTLKSNENLDNQACYVVETKFSAKDAMGYSKTIDWIRQDNFIPVKTEFYDKDGQLKKVKTIPVLEQKSGSWIMKKMVMKDVQSNHSTTIEIVESNPKPVEDSYFTPQFLQRTDKE